MPRDVIEALKRRTEFIFEQEAVAPRRKVTRVPAPAGKRGTLFALRNKNLAIKVGGARTAQIVITYKKTTGKRETNKYVVAPYEFKFRRLKIGRRKVLWAYDMDDKHIKSFVLSNIRKVAITDRKFTPNRSWDVSRPLFPTT